MSAVSHNSLACRRVSNVRSECWLCLTALPESAWRVQANALGNVLLLTLPWSKARSVIKLGKFAMTQVKSTVIGFTYAVAALLCMLSMCCPHAWCTGCLGCFTLMCGVVQRAVTLAVAMLPSQSP